jgi:hypothetical protein
VGDVTADERYLEALGDTRSEIIVPVLDPDDGRVIGTLDVESQRRGAFGPGDQRALERAAAVLLPLWTRRAIPPRAATTAPYGEWRRMADEAVGLAGGGHKQPRPWPTVHRFASWKLFNDRQHPPTGG